MIKLKGFTGCQGAVFTRDFSVIAFEAMVINLSSSNVKLNSDDKPTQLVTTGVRARANSVPAAAGRWRRVGKGGLLMRAVVAALVVAVVGAAATSAQQLPDPSPDDTYEVFRLDCNAQVTLLPRSPLEVSAELRPVAQFFQRLQSMINVRGAAACDSWSSQEFEALYSPVQAFVDTMAQLAGGFVTLDYM